MLEVISFDYNNKNEVKNRVLAVLQKPTDKYFGISLDELDTLDQGVFCAELANILDARTTEINALLAKYDINHSFRYFMPEKMANIVKD